MKKIMNFGGRKITYDPKKINVEIVNDKCVIKQKTRNIGEYPNITVKINKKVHYRELVVVNQDGSVIGCMTDWTFNGVDETPVEISDTLMEAKK